MDEDAVYAHDELKVLAAGDECGISIIKSKDNKKRNVKQLVATN